MSTLLEVRGLSKHFPVRRGVLRRLTGAVRALEAVDMTLSAGETYSLVGESGSGKTTLGRCVLRLIEPTAGSIAFRGEDLTALRGAALRSKRRFFQMIFQDPYGSLNPRMRVGKIVAEPLAVHGVVAKADRQAEVARLLEMVGLDPAVAKRFPHEFSGGQRQRVGIARALAPRPSLVVADEPVSALDVSIQAQIINLLSDLKEELGLTLLFISHDLAVVEQISDRVGVLYLGKLVEEAPAADLFANPRHPYTVSLLSAVPVPDPATGRKRIILPGDPPSPTDPPSGCAFHPRCPIATERCAREEPALVAPPGSGHLSACHYPGELERQRSVSADGGGTF